MFKRMQGLAGSDRWKDRSLVPYLVGFSLLFIMLLIPIVSMVRMTYRFQEFKQDLAESIAFAEERGTLERSDADRLYKLVVDAGMGKPQKTVPSDGGARYEFGDGCVLELWEVDIDGNPQNPGTLIRFTRADGSVFCYDTDQIPFRFAADALTDAKVV